MRRTPLVLLTVSLFGACIAVPEAPGIPRKLTDEDSGAAGYVSVDASSPGLDAKSEMSMTDPHKVIAVEPSHGPFSGGQHALVRGNGFAPDARVWFADIEADPADIVRVDAGRLQVSVPAGAPGPADVRVQNGADPSTSRTLLEGYTYDAFYAQPSSGPTSGGTLITLKGKGVSWSASTVVKVGGKECTDLKVVSGTELKCATPPHPAASVSIVVGSNADAIAVEDGFVYADSDNGFKGGLSGELLNGTIQVGAYNNYTGLPIAGATVVLGDSLAASIVQKTGASGITVFNDVGLVGKRSVSLAKKCYEPQTFVDVTVDRVTAYLNPIMSPECGTDGGDVPPVGGKGATPALIQGQLVWTGGTEFKRAPWTNVPGPKGANEKQAAYLFTPSYDPTYPFYLPDVTSAVRPESDGTIGYSFSYSVYPGNTTLYAVAGLEDRSVYPNIFVAYALGIVKGIATQPNGVTSDVYIMMDKPLDQQVTLQIKPPLPGPKGPDRVHAGVSIQLASDSYVILPNTAHVVPIAADIPMDIFGLPGLDKSLAGTHFISYANAATGANKGPPQSVVGYFSSIDATLPVGIDGFVQVPVMTTPAAGGQFDGSHIEYQTAPGATSIDLTVLRLGTSGGLVEWTVAVPGGKTSIELPDLGSLGIGLPSGPVDISIYCAHIDPFDYGNLLYRHLSQRGWNAYSYDVFHVFY